MITADNGREIKKPASRNAATPQRRTGKDNRFNG